MKRMLWVSCTFTLLLICTIGLTACDTSAPQFDDNPISASGDFRWEEDFIYLDITITNNSNKDIKQIVADYDASGMVNNEAILYGEGAFPFVSRKFKTLKSGASRTYSIDVFRPNLGSHEADEMLDVIACKVTFSVNGIEFGSYGRMSFDEELIVFSFEGFK